MTFGGKETLKGELENDNSKYIVAKIDDEVVGFAGIWKAVFDMHITNIVVRKDLRSLGIGKLLLERLIKMSKCEDVVSITLEVNSNNLPAIKLYEKFGFKNVGVRKNYYKNTDDAIIMTLNL